MGSMTYIFSYILKELAVSDRHYFNKRFEPGAIVPISGQYARVDLQGNVLKLQVTCVKGEHFPPAQYRGQTFTLVDITVHTSALSRLLGH